jgi:HEPN domain-containing protein
MDDASRSLAQAFQFLAGAQDALNAGAFDAAHANASVAARAAVRVLTDDRARSPRAHPSQTIALVQEAEANGKVPDDVACELKSLLEVQGRGLFESIDHDEAVRACSLASSVTAIAAGQIAARCFSLSLRDTDSFAPERLVERRATSGWWPGEA